MSDKFEPRTPASKRKQTVKSTPSTSKAQLHLEYTPNKRSKPDVTVKNIEDEEFPEGFTLLETINTPGKSEIWKALDKENKPPSSTTPESQTSEENANVKDPQNLSMLAHYDEIIRCYEEYFDDDLTEEFLEFAEHQELCRVEWLKSVQECQRLRGELDKAHHEIGDFANKLKNARRLLDQEKKLRNRAEEERNSLEQQMQLARDLLFSDKTSRLPDDTREKLAFLNNTTLRSHASFDRNGYAPGPGPRLNTISEVNSQELNSTGSLLSDFSYSRSEDGLDASTVMKSEVWKRPQHLAQPVDNSSPQKRRSSTHKVVEINPTDKIVATTTVSVSKEGPITATSIIEAVPQDPEPQRTLHPPGIVESLWLGMPKSPALNSVRSASSIRRDHAFISKAVIRPDTCGACNQRIRFGKIAFKCKECRGICHAECKSDLALPCVPIMNTPTQKGVIGIIADYAPTLPPMVPALIVHCINEIELRGLNEVGIYRVPGSEKDVKMLKDKLLRSRSPPTLNEIDVHVLCGVVKDFLRSLREPLITCSLRKDFIQAVEARDELDINPSLIQAISQLPQPNRDTLAYIMVHLHRVAQSKECKMPAGNLAKVFGLTLIGYSSQDIEPQEILTETRQQVSVMEYLMKIPLDFWVSFVNTDSNLTTPHNRNMVQTPSTESLARSKNGGGFFTPYGSKSAQTTRKRRKFFATPPSKK